MKFKVAKKAIDKALGDYGFTYEITQEEEDAIIGADLTINSLNGTSVYVKGYVFSTDITVLSFIFNKVLDYEAMYPLINRFNYKNKFLRAFIDEEDDFLVIDSVDYTTTDANSISQFLFNTFENLVSDETIELLSPMMDYLEENEE